MPSQEEQQQKEEGPKKEGSFRRLWNKMMSNEHIDLNQQIHERLNQEEERRKRLPRRSTTQEELLKSFPLGLHKELSEMFSMMPTSSSSSTMSASSRSSNSFGVMSSYHMRQDQKGVQVTVNVPGATADDLNVQVLQTLPTCIVEWSGKGGSNGKTKFHERLRLGSAVDCDQLSAKLSSSRGVLQIEAPNKDITNEKHQVRVIPITEND